MMYEEHGVKITVIIIINPSVTLGFKFQPVSTGVRQSQYKLPRSDPVEGARGQIMLHNYAFAFLDSIISCPLYIFTLSDQTQVTLQLTVSLSELT
jgi:hypothetical protein